VTFVALRKISKGLFWIRW